MFRMTAIRRIGVLAILVLLAAPAAGAAQQKQKVKPRRETHPTRSAPPRAKRAPTRPARSTPRVRRTPTRRSTPARRPARKPTTRSRRERSDRPAVRSPRVERHTGSRARSGSSAIERARAMTRRARASRRAALGHRTDFPVPTFADDRAVRAFGDDFERPVRHVRPVPFVELVFEAPGTLLETEPPSLPRLAGPEIQPPVHRASQRRGPVARLPEDDMPDVREVLRPPTTRRREPPPTPEQPVVRPPESGPPETEPPETEPPVREPPPTPPPSDLGRAFSRDRRLFLALSRRCNDLGWDLSTLWRYGWVTRSPLYDPIWDDPFARTGCGDPFDGVAMPTSPDYAVEAECAVVTVEDFNEKVRSFTVALPALSARNAKALRIAIEQQLDRGMSVFLWDEDGNEIRLDPEAVDNLSVERCDR